MTTQPKTPTLAQLRKLAKRKGAFVIQRGYKKVLVGPGEVGPLMAFSTALIFLSALPDAKGGQR